MRRSGVYSIGASTDPGSTGTSASNPEEVRVAVLETDLGQMLAGATRSALLFLEFAGSEPLSRRMSDWSKLSGVRVREGENQLLEHVRQELTAYFAGNLRSFSAPLALFGTPFQTKVWQALAQIPYGTTVDYGSLAGQLGCSAAVRAVAGANARNRIAIIVPCHRVIGRNGKLTGYAGGMERKRYLLEHEAKVAGRSVQTRLF